MTRIKTYWQIEVDERTGRMTIFFYDKKIDKIEPIYLQMQKNVKVPTLLLTISDVIIQEKINH